MEGSLSIIKNRRNQELKMQDRQSKIENERCRIVVVATSLGGLKHHENRLTGKGEEEPLKLVIP